MSSYSPNDLAISKIILFYFMDKANIPLTSLQLTRHITLYDWINYFELQQIVVELTESKMLEQIITPDGIKYKMTDSGKEALSYFKNMLPINTKISMDDNMPKVIVELKKESAFVADYKKIADAQYMATCKIIENNILLMELSINVVTEKQAQNICNNWANTGSEMYKSVVNMLLNENKCE